MLKILNQRLSECEGVDIQRILEFIDEMKVAQSSAYYNNDRMNRYRSLNLSEAIDMADSASSSSMNIRIGMLRSRLSNTRKYRDYENNVIYF